MSRRPLIHRARRIATFVIAFAAGVWVCDQWMTSRVVAADAQDGASTTRPATTMPATTRAAATRPTLPPEVAAIAQRVRAAYAQRPIRLQATLTSDFDVAGMRDHAKHTISGVLESPSRFKHESAGEFVVAADGTWITALDVANNAFEKQALGGDANAPKLSDDAQAALAQQNPALLVAVTGNVESIFMPVADAKVSVLPQEAGQAGDRVRVSTPDKAQVTYTIDADRGTIAQVDWNFVDLLNEQGAKDVHQASASLKYDRTDLGGDAIPAEQLAFVTPAGAREATASDASELLADVGAGGDPSAALTGNAAPAVELSDVDGTVVEAVGADAPQGDVVVLDFWATWCPPCRAGLPHLAEVAEKFKARGVRVYAVNQREDADTVRRFLKDQKLSLTALLDADGEAGKRYRVRGIPQTVVIGRDGKVQKVIVGFSPASAHGLDDAVENALK